MKSHNSVKSVFYTFIFGYLYRLFKQDRNNREQHFQNKLMIILLMTLFLQIINYYEKSIEVQN